MALCDSESNPADDASRGLKMSRFLERKRWINRLSFLWKPIDEWPKRPTDVSISAQNDPDVAAVSTNTLVSYQRNDMMEYFTRFSQWYRLKKIVAWLLRVKSVRDRSKQSLVKSPAQSGEQTHQPIMVEEL